MGEILTDLPQGYTNVMIVLYATVAGWMLSVTLHVPVFPGMPADSLLGKRYLRRNA